MPNNFYQKKLKKIIKKKTVIFIDAANLERSVQDMWVNPQDIPDELKGHTTDRLKWKIDYKKFKSYFKNICNSAQIKFYTANFQTASHNKFLSFLKKALNFDLITKPLKEYKDHTKENPHRKANFDVEIAVDTVENIEKFKTFILFSGDCDFEYLLKYLRGKNKTTIVFSRKGHIAKELPPASNCYFDIIDFRYKFLKIVPNAKNSA